MRITFFRTLFATLPLALAPLFTGCGRDQPPAQPPIDARTIGNYRMWRSHTSGHRGREAWQEFDAAITEIRLSVMGREGASGAAAIDALLCEKINGLTFEQALLLGYETKSARLEDFRRAFLTKVDANALLVTLPRDTAGAERLNELRADQAQRLRALADEITACQKRLAELRGTDTPAAAAAEPTRLSRNEALAEIQSLYSSRRMAARKRLGSEPLRFDFEGAELPSALRREFVSRKAAALKAGRSAVAVGVAGSWFIFDRPVEPLEFSPAVTANLTAADRAQIASDWFTLEAEIWARESALSSVQPQAVPAVQPRKRELAVPLRATAPNIAMPRPGPPAVRVDLPLKEER